MPASRIPFKGFGKLTIADAQTSLPTPPVTCADVATAWNTGSKTPAEFDIEIKAAGAVDLTDFAIAGVVQDQRAITSDDVDVVDFANDELDIAAHGLLNGDGPIRLTTTDTLPAGLSLATDYYVIFVGAGTIKLATSLKLAVEGTAVAFTDAGTGTHSILGSVSGDFLEGSNNSYSIQWLDYGLLGRASDGAISLTSTVGYSVRINHRPRTVLYAVEATLSAAVAVTVDIYAVHDAN